MLQSKAEYIDARPLTASSAKPLATHGRTIHWVIADIGGRRDHVRSYLESRHRPRHMSAEMTQIEFFVARYIVSGEHTFGFGRGCLHEQARQIRYIVLSPTTRRSILLIRSERSTSAALMAAIVCRNVLTFDPSDTIPPSTTAIDPMATI